LRFQTDDAWRIRVRDTISRAYSNERDAISVAFDHARNLGKQGYDVEVAMKVLTCRFGSEGIIRTSPSPIRASNGNRPAAFAAADSTRDRS
jgi:hypothetical protein